MSAEPDLLGAIGAALVTVEALAAHPALAPADAQALAATAAAVRARLGRDEVAVAIAGEARAGKTTLLEAATAAGVPAGFRLLDTPGLNDGEPGAAERAWALIEREADVVLIASDLQQAVSRTTRDAVARIGKVAPHVLLALTKADRALANAELAADPAAEVAEARRVAVRRFAAEVGRQASDVLAVSVAAGPALRDAAAAEAFRQDLAPMWALLRQERALALAGRAAALLEGAAAAIRAAVGRAGEAAEARVASLMAQRLPDPAAFRAEAVTRAREALVDPEGWKQAAQGFRVALARQGMRWEVAIRKAVGEEEARAAAAGAAEAARAALAEILAATRDVAMEALAERAADAREAAIADLRARYRLAGEIAGAPQAFPEPAPLDPAATAAPLDAGLGAALAGFDEDRVKLGWGGAAAGAAVGTAIAPGIGTAIGALVGSLGGLFMNVELLKVDLLRSLTEGLAAAEAAAVQAIVAGGAAAEAALGEAIARDVDAAIGACAGRIDALLAAEHAALAAAHADAAALTALGGRLEADLAGLRGARERAAAASRAMAT